MAEKSYKYIRAWGILFGSRPGYIDYLIRKARLYKAPANAIYFSGGKWVTLEDIPSEDTKLRLFDIDAELK